MVLDYWGQPTSRDDLIAQLRTDPDVGTPGSRILQLRLRGLAVTYRPVTELDLQQWLAQRIPVILLVDIGQLPCWSRRAAHAIVLKNLVLYATQEILRRCAPHALSAKRGRARRNDTYSKIDDSHFHVKNEDPSGAVPEGSFV